jgi:tetratricopeptide (TPR) repeat protein
MTWGVILVVVILGVPALVWTLWPLLRRGRETGRAFLPLPPDAREQLGEQKRRVLRTLRELEFEHDAGHVSDEDYADLRSRYEAEAAAILSELDRLGVPEPRPEPAPKKKEVVAVRQPLGWRHPLAIGTSAVALLAFGVAIGVGVVRYTEPDRQMGPLPGSRPLASLDAPVPPGPGPSPMGTPPAGDAAAGGGAPRPVSPEMLRGMLQAARSSLFEGRYGEAIAAYQAVLKRDPKNVDAMTHLGLIVAIGGHADSALESFEKALAIDPNYPPALLYRGQVLYEVKGDTPAAIKSWEKFITVAPPGEDRERVSRMIAEAKAKPASRK